MSKTKIPTIIKMSPQFLVDDFEGAIEFYTKKLGFLIDFRYLNFYAGIIKDGFSIHLKAGKPNVEERKNKRLNEDLDIVFGVRGVDQLYEEFQNNAVDIVQPLCDRPYGREFYIADPEGYILAFLEDV